MLSNVSSRNFSEVCHIQSDPLIERNTSKLKTSFSRQKIENLCVLHHLIFCCVRIQVVFEGIRGRSYSGDLAIDDVAVMNGPCPPPGTCDFEKGLCAYQNDLSTDDFDWERNRGHAGSIGTGPSADHTTGSSFGRVLCPFLFTNKFLLVVRLYKSVLGEYLGPYKMLDRQ